MPCGMLALCHPRSPTALPGTRSTSPPPQRRPPAGSRRRITPPDHAAGSRRPDCPVTRRFRRANHSVTRSPESPGHPITRSPDHPVTRSPDHPITRLPQTPLHPSSASLTAKRRTKLSPCPLSQSLPPKPTARPTLAHSSCREATPNQDRRCGLLSLRSYRRRHRVRRRGQRRRCCRRLRRGGSRAGSRCRPSSCCRGRRSIGRAGAGFFGVVRCPA